MGMAVGQSGQSGGRRRRRKRNTPISEINVTPFVDVMLVLLIIFMVAAPILLSGVPIDLPESRAKQLNTQTQPLVISARSDGRIFLQETEIELSELVARLKAISKLGLEERIQFKGDKQLTYGQAMAVLGVLNEAGFKKLGLVSLPDQGGQVITPRG